MGLNMGGTGELKTRENLHFLHVLRLVGHLYGKFMEILNLTAPGNYSAPIWYNIFEIAYRRNRNSSFL